MSNEQNAVALKRRRTSIKASCTRIKTYVDSIQSVTPTVIAQLEERKLKLNEYWSEYSDVQSQIEVIDENESNDSAAFEEAFYNLSAKIREILHPESLTRSTAFSPSSSRASDQSQAQLNVRLPKLNLPSFSGKYDEWFPFFDSFNSIIHSNVALSNIQKLQYLKASVSGDASKVISSLEIADINYEVAWNLFKERYENKRIIVYTHIKAMMELPTMVKENSSELRQITDGAIKHIQALQALRRPTSQWDDLLTYILSSKLDALTLREWQASLVGTDPPTFKQFTEFITRRCQMLEASGKSIEVASRSHNKHSQPNSKRQSACVATIKAKCNYCNGDHPIYYCKDFLALSTSQRIAEVRKRKICNNCLRSPTHPPNKCTSSGCRVCKERHNTLLHAGTDTTEANGVSGSGQIVKTEKPPTTVVAQASNHTTGNHVMLSTAIIDVVNGNGSLTPCRALLDCGAQANFISKECMNSLGLKPLQRKVSIRGISDAVVKLSQVVIITLKSRTSTYSATIECVVSDQVTGKIPAFSTKKDAYLMPRNIKLADSQFNVSSSVDILIGAEIFWELLCVGQIKATNDHPTLQKTRLGWILVGRIANNQKIVQGLNVFHAAVICDPLHEQIARFWQLEDVVTTTNRTSEETSCEEHFLKNVSRTSQGRYVVKLPVKEAIISKLGESEQTALKRLQGMERRFTRNPDLRNQYNQFMEEYLRLGHMKRVDTSREESKKSFYLPHHAVFKTSESPSRIRVVFDASCKSNSGTSLNQALKVGPVIQEDLVSIMMRFRTFAYVLVADIIKMYRQILVHSSQTCLQRILWRSDPMGEVETYELLTLTYGTASASYLATRCLKHLAEQYSSNYPVGSLHVQRDFYVDDLLTGADIVQEACKIRDEYIRLLKLGSFELSKWASNYPELVDQVDEVKNESIIIKDGSSSRVLGMQWNRNLDTFHFTYDPNVVCGKQEDHIIRSFKAIRSLGPSRAGYCYSQTYLTRSLAVQSRLGRIRTTRHAHSMEQVHITAARAKSTGNLQKSQI